MKADNELQNTAHSFTEGSEVPKVEHPDFPQWIKSRPGLDCMKWPVGDETYLFNRLFWAFDAGRNCVWDQYVSQKAELTRLRSELQQRDEVIKELIGSISVYVFQMDKFFGDPKVGQPPGMEKFRELIAKTKAK